MKKKDLPDEEVVIKISTCNKCNNVVRSAVLHLMTSESKKDFMKEVSKYNLNVKHQPLLEFRNESQIWCKCK